MERAKTTPKDFFLWAGAMVALYWCAIAFIFLIFNYIDYAFVNPLSYLPPNPYDSGIGYQMASIIVLFPVYVALMWIIRSDITKDASRVDVWVRRWALILTLFVAGATMAGDLIALITKFLSGEEMTVAFVLKAVVLFLLAATAFMHFIADFWGYWERNVAYRRTVCWSVGALAALSIVAGFVMFGSPASARLYRLDEQRVSDLQSIQWQVVSYWQRKQSLPENLAALNDPLSGYQVPTDPSTGTPYGYKRNSPLDFAVCATFAREDRGSVGTSGPRPASPYPTGSKTPDSWSHGTGEVCFDRSIDPELYPPYKPATD